MAEETGGAEHPVFAYIDAVRGYAILLVITSNLTFSYPELPYPVHRLTVLGWHGKAVQRSLVGWTEPDL